MEWKDLDISNIPGDFFVSERYEVEVKSERTYNFIPIYTDPSNRYDIIKNLTEGTEYRYRLKPLEIMKIPKDLIEAKSIIMSTSIKREVRNLEYKYKCKVETID